jgi:hypothetical protein
VSAVQGRNVVALVEAPADLEADWRERIGVVGHRGVVAEVVVHEADVRVGGAEGVAVGLGEGDGEVVERGFLIGGQAVCRVALREAIGPVQITPEEFEIALLEGIGKRVAVDMEQSRQRACRDLLFRRQINAHTRRNAGDMQEQQADG